MCIEEIKDDEKMLAIIIYSNYNKPGITFFTSGDLSQQVAYMQHCTGHIIKPHVHNKVTREVHYTQEVLMLRKGKLRVDFYNTDKEYLKSRILNAGDLILLASGGHGFKVIEEVEMFEIKQGPYAGDGDKTRFVGINDDDAVLLGSDNDA